MKRIFQTPQSAFPLALSLLVVAGIGAVTMLLPEDVARADSHAWVLGVLVVAGCILGLYRPRHGLALGATTLAPVTFYFGPVAGGLLAGVVRAAQLLLRPAVERSGARRRAQVELGAVLVGSFGAALAGLLAAAAWYFLVQPRLETEIVPGLAGGFGVGIVQVAALVVLGATARWVGVESAGRAEWLEPWRLLDVAGWTLGGVLVTVFAHAGVVAGLAVLLCAVLLVAELTRNEIKLARRDRQLDTLSELSSVSHRVGVPRGELTRVAERLLGECHRVVPAEWLGLTIVDRDSEARSWSRGPDGELEEGAPRPPEAPPPIPGLHRRASWQILDRDLVSGERTIATLRLWTDPRKTDWEQIELLDSLLPQLATSLGAVLADEKASRDALTKLATRSVLEDELERAFAAAVEEGAPLSVVMCDIDHFKAVNDEHGHATGDRALREIAAVLEEHSRGRDTVCRYGGEEFTVLMEGAAGKAAVAAAERLRKAAQEVRIPSDGKPLMLTISLGVASFPETYVTSGSELLPLADAALYQAKRRGRNRTVLALGQGRFQNARGQRLKGDATSDKIEAPRLFV